MEDSNSMNCVPYHVPIPNRIIQSTPFAPVMATLLGFVSVYQNMYIFMIVELGNEPLDGLSPIVGLTLVLLILCLYNRLP